MLAALMYASKIIMDLAPNIHLIGVFVIAITVVYRKKALYPIYIFVLLTGLLNGFSAWWVPYTYIWTVLWAVTMLLPERKLNRMPKKAQMLIYMVTCSLHGFCYGLLYAPAQAILFGLSFEGMVSWILAGLPFDLIHGVSNFFCGMLVMPIVTTLRMAERTRS